MDSSNASNMDIEEHFSSFLNISSFFRNISKDAEDLLPLVDILSSDLELARSQQNTLTQQMQNLSSDKSVTVAYSELQERYEALQKQNDDMKMEIENFQLIHKAEVEILKEKLNTEKKMYQEDVLKEIDKKKLSFEHKEKELDEKLRALQTACLMQYSDMESHLQSMLQDSNRKLKESMETNDNLRAEIRFLQNKLNITGPDQSATTLKEKLRITEEQLKIAQLHLSRNGISFEPEQNVSSAYTFQSGGNLQEKTDVSKKMQIEALLTKYCPLEVNSSDENVQAVANCERNRPAEFNRTFTSKKNDIPNYNKKYDSKSKLPALIEVSSNNNNNNDGPQQNRGPRKRKLFNPENQTK